MSKPVDNPADGDAGRFWDLYGTAGSPRTRVRTEPPPVEPAPAHAEPPPAHTVPPGPASGEDHAHADDPNGHADGGPTHDRAAGGSPHAAHECLEWCPICRGAEVLRAGGSPEIRGQLQSVQRDSLMMLRALIDSYLQRPPAEPPRDGDGVEDIPII